MSNDALRLQVEKELESAELIYWQGLRGIVLEWEGVHKTPSGEKVVLRQCSSNECRSIVYDYDELTGRLTPAWSVSA